MDNFEGIGESCTNAVRAWLGGSGSGTDPDMFRLQRFSNTEARKLAAEAPDFVQAASLLQAWFTDRLTVEPGVAGPFAPIDCAAESPDAAVRRRDRGPRRTAWGVRRRPFP